MRLFIAFQIGEEERARLYQKSCYWREAVDGVKWVDETNYHITLLFLGECQQVERVAEILKEIEFSPLSVELSSSPTLFPQKSPKVVAYRVLEGAEECTGYYRRVKRELAPYLRLEKRGYYPHLTIGRVKAINRVKEVSVPEGEKIVTQLTGIALYQSILKKSGAVYQPLASCREVFRGS